MTASTKPITHWLTLRSTTLYNKYSPLGVAKIDTESAFRNIPVHPHDWHLLSMMWQEKLYIDMFLPLGLRSAPKIFNCIADALQWITQHLGVSFVELFLDHFIVLGRPNSNKCNENLLILMLICIIFGLPLAPSNMSHLSGHQAEHTSYGRPLT